MAKSLNVRLGADWAALDTALDGAKVSLTGFDRAVNAAGSGLKRAMEGFSGSKVIAEAHTMTEAYRRLAKDGVGLTESEQRRLNAAVTEGIAKYRAMGQQAPADMLKVQQATTQATGSFGLAGGAVGGLQKGITGLIGSLGAMAGPAALGYAAKATVAWADGLSDLSDATHISIGSLQRIERAAEGAGSSLEEVTGVVAVMTAKIGGGDAGVVAAIEKLGLNLSDLRQQDPGQTFIDLATAVDKTENAYTRAELKQAVFGKGSKDLDAALHELARAHGDQIVASDDSVRALGGLSDRIGDLFISAKALSAEGLGQVTLGLTAMSDWAAIAGGALAGATGDMERFNAVANVFSSDLPTVASPKLIADPLAAPGLPADYDAIIRKQTAGLERLAEADRKVAAAAALATAAAVKWAAELDNASGKSAVNDMNRLLKVYEALQSEGLPPTIAFQTELVAAIVAGVPAADALGLHVTTALRAIALAAPATIAAINGVVNAARESVGVMGLGPGGKPTLGAYALPGGGMTTLAGSPGSKSPGSAGTAGYDWQAFGRGAGEVIQRSFEGGGNPTKALGAYGINAAVDKLSTMKLGGLGKVGGGAIAGLGAGIEAFSVGAQQGKAKGALSGAASGAMAGMAFGPWGAAVGAGVGAIAGFVGGLTKYKPGAVAQQAADKDILGTQGALLEKYGSVANIGKMGKQGAEVAAAWGDRNVQGLEHFNKLVDNLNISLEYQANVTGQIGDAESDLASLREEQVPTWQQLEASAEKYGVNVDALGPAFQQLKSNDFSQELLSAFEQLTKAGGDVGGVLIGMADEISTIAQNSIKFGTTIPENMRPLIDELARSGNLLDANGNKMTDLSGLKWGPPVETQAEIIGKAIDRLTVLLSTLHDDLARGMPAAAAAGTAGVSTVIDNYDPPTVHIPVRYDDPGAAPGGDLTEAHTGGLVTTLGLRRFHSGGLASNEMLAVLQAGEMVLPRHTVSRLSAGTRARLEGGGGRGGGDGIGVVNVNVDGDVLTSVVLRRTRGVLAAAGLQT